MSSLNVLVFFLEFVDLENAIYKAVFSVLHNLFSCQGQAQRLTESSCSVDLMASFAACLFSALFYTRKMKLSVTEFAVIILQRG